MSDIAAQFNTMLIKSGFQKVPPNGKFSSIGNFYCLPKSFGEGIYWLYGEKNLFNIKIHDFYFFEDEFFRSGKSKLAGEPKHHLLRICIW